MVRNFKLTLSISKLPGEELVYQKQDGQRFSNCHTVKLNVNTSYRLLLATRPANRIRHLQIQGEKAEYSEVKPDRNDQEEEESYRVEAKWVTTACSLTRRAKRSEVPLLLEFDDGVNLKLVLQVKFYPEPETEHAHWGQQLHGIEYECTVPEGATYVDIKKEKYF